MAKNVKTMGHGNLHPYPQDATDAAKMLLDRVRGKDVDLACAAHAAWHLVGFAQSNLLPDTDHIPPETHSPHGYGEVDHADHEGAEDEPKDTMEQTTRPKNAPFKSKKTVGFKHTPDPLACPNDQVEHVLACAAGERAGDTPAGPEGEGMRAGTVSGIFTEEFLSKLMSVAMKLLMEWMISHQTK